MKIKGENRYNKSYRSRHDDQKMKLKSDRRMSRKSARWLFYILFSHFTLAHVHIEKLTLRFVCCCCFSLALSETLLDE